MPILILPASNHPGERDEEDMKGVSKRFFEVTKLGIIRSKQSKSSPDFCIQPLYVQWCKGVKNPSLLLLNISINFVKRHNFASSD